MTTSAEFAVALAAAGTRTLILTATPGNGSGTPLLPAQPQSEIFRSFLRAPSRDYHFRKSGIRLSAGGALRFNCIRHA